MSDKIPGKVVRITIMTGTGGHTTLRSISHRILVILQLITEGLISLDIARYTIRHTIVDITSLDIVPSIAHIIGATILAERPMPTDRIMLAHIKRQGMFVVHTSPLTIDTRRRDIIITKIAAILTSPDHILHITPTHIHI